MNLNEKTLETKIVYDGKIMRVLKDDIELSNGKKCFREVVEHSGGVVVLAIKNGGPQVACHCDCLTQKSQSQVQCHSNCLTQENQNDKVLMVKQFRYPIKKAILELPAGKLEKGEDPDLAAKRELEEETGYRAKNWTPLGFIYTSAGYSDEKLYLYKATDLEFVGECPDEVEILQCSELFLEDVLNMVQDGEINDAKTICALMRGLKIE